MVFLRAFFRGLLLLIILVSVALWTVAATLQMTLFNRETVKGWVQKSGAYENIVDTIEIRQVDVTGIVTSEMLRGAIGAVITPAYIQKQAEGVLDAAYNWLDGSAPAITYSIPIHEQRGSFIEHLGKQLEEKLRSLPQCSGISSFSQPCIPRAYTVETYAASIAKQTAEDSDLFEKPIVSDTAQLVSALQQLPPLVALSAIATWLLPIVIALCGGAYVALSRKWRQGIANLGKRLVFSSATLVVIGVLAWVFGGSLNLGARLFGGSDMAIITAVVEPLLEQGVTSVGMWLAIYSGSVVLIGMLLWVIGYTLQRRRRRGSNNDAKTSPATPKPIARPPSAGPTPPRKPMSF